MDYSVFEKFCAQTGVQYKLLEPMCCHSGFKTGGNADIFINIQDIVTLKSVLQASKALSVPIFVLGKGSNILVSDRGIEGAVLTLGGMDKIKINGTTVTAEAGASLTALCVEVQKAGLSGLEFAYGIPGSIGGALFMNAGAYNGEMADVVASAKFITKDGVEGEIKKDEMNLGYRQSIFRENGNIITEVTLELIPGDECEIREKMNCLMEKRRSKQPLEFPSAGSTFKRPNGYFAGALIEESGLKGTNVGGAQVSVKHAGFVINKGGATTDDILSLMEKIKNTVFEKKGITLEPEVIFVGRK